jgi:hypothetical protein
MVGSLLQPIPAYMLRTCVQSRETMDEFDRQDVMSPLQLQGVDDSHMSVGVTLFPAARRRADHEPRRCDKRRDEDINSH